MRLFLATLAILLALAAPAAAAPTWLPASFLTDEAVGTPISSIAVAPDGTAVAAWSRDTGGGGFGVEIARRAPGGGFAVVCSPTTGGQNGRTPQVAMNAQGDATIVWAETPAGTIRATRLDAGGRLERFGAERATPRSQLRRARGPRELRRLASRLARAHATAAASLAPSVPAVSALGGLVRTLRSAARSYRRLALAAAGGRIGRYDRARRAITAADRALERRTPWSP